MGITIGAQASQGRLEYLAVHYFGRVLGFGKETDRDDNYERLPDGTACGSAAPVPGVMLTAYDRDSIMHPCNFFGNITARLSKGDITGAQAVYGPSAWYQSMKNRLLPLMNRAGTGRMDALYIHNSGGYGYIFASENIFAALPTSVVGSTSSVDALAWLTGDSNQDDLTDIFRVWNNNGSVELIVYPWKPGYSWPVPSQQLQGSLQAFKYLPVDVDGDGRTDIAELSAASAGQLQISVHAATANNTYQTTATTVMTGGYGAVEWLTGDVDADGRTDIFQIWNNGGNVGLIISKGNDVCDCYVNGWVDTSGIQGPIADSRFFAFDIDNDSRTDLIQARNANDTLELRVHKNVGGLQFTTTYTALMPAGSGAVDWLVGDTNLDGIPDLMQLWSDFGRLNVILWRWNGTAFVSAYATNNITAPTTALAFHAGDLDGDGDADIVQYRDDGHGKLLMSLYRYVSATNEFVQYNNPPVWSL
ncbi:VCBS repeat-containing protein [Myxococcus sp. CA051A]|uniref:FG-GAP repeat domain-containing protein n=1 Tax=Myxococcus sp. CA051A TaxID=2741739 RepID=UPI00157B27FF|nr:VCBS repeat-containing protein [Myxococcus sp. CA051A]NTX65739.1 VCBS repeat-containing protein [Myxococcus sp. CA051A]